MVDIQSAAAEIWRGKNRKTETTGHLRRAAITNTQLEELLSAYTSVRMIKHNCHTQHSTEQF